ncbi:protein snakeskin [Lucilia cuprina]|uniref:protein snakeskin n=1 Tax=Lucilia cuprina TaxID=7375 RepID=UPI000C71B729|nr:protein snakeskin [Lucilia cuprina]XP_037824109.1 protein snakeskin-like [Lucilia sericata]
MQFNNRLILKIIELVIAIVCIILWETNGNFSNNALIVCGTMGGFTIICGVLLLGHIINSVVEKRLNGLFSIIGCVLFVISGALIIDQWHDRSDLLFKESKRNALAAGSLMIINGAVFLMDTISIFRTRAEIPVIREVSKNKLEINRY